MGRTTRSTRTTAPTLDVEALIASIASTVTAQVLAQLDAGIETPASAPVETTRQKNARLKREQKAKAEKAALADARKAEFFGSIAANREDNAALAAWCREKGLVPNGLVWKAVKDGESKMSVLKPLAEQDKADREARAAAKKASRKA